MREVINWPDKWYKKRNYIEVTELRNRFLAYHGSQAECTCDSCIDITRCYCAYDLYNSSGDCLMEK